jgi:outer membrane receptor protein involved in Fe transport
MIARQFILNIAFAMVVSGSVAAQGSPSAAQVRDEDRAQDELLTFEEQVVVSASRTEQLLVNAPATVSLVTAQAIEQSPATNVGDLLRGVPGVNVVQLSARDVNLTTRGATSTLSTRQLALVDGRTIYLDFFGMVLWDLVPSNLHEIRQIEVIRGPASAVWGANAMNGVVNVITKSPRELAAQGGTSLVVSAGAFGRAIPGRDEDPGGIFSVNASHAQAVDDRWAYKVSAGYFAQHALPRPTGTIANPFNTPYPDYVNSGTSQPKFDARVDRELAAGQRLTFAGGVAGTRGIVHTGIGPFDISSGRLTYFTTRYEQGGRRLAFFTNILDGDATNLLARGPTGEFLPLLFDTQTFDVEASDVRPGGTRHVFTYGGNLRHNRFDISLAPDGDNRTEGGAYVQDEMFLTPYLRWVIGGRLDKFSSIDRVVFSPRTTVLLKPAPSQSIRLSFNRAFRAPSFINNHIETSILNEANLSAISPALSQFVFPVQAVGNPDLVEEKLTALELGYSAGVGGSAMLSAAVYWNRIDDAIFFTQIGRYTAANPPPGWPALIPTAVLNLLPEPGLPSLFTYQNLGRTTDRGLELGVEAVLNPSVSAFTNYTYQARPRVSGFDPREVNVSPRHRFNVGFNASVGRAFGNLMLSFTDESYWSDVLDLRFAGNTDAYTIVNGGLGFRWMDGRVVTSAKVTNLTNEAVMQHIFADVQRRQVLGEVRVGF